MASAPWRIKSATEVSGNDFSGLRAFRNDNPAVPLVVVYRGTQAYRTDDIRVIPWRTFLDEVRQDAVFLSNNFSNLN